MAVNGNYSKNGSGSILIYSGPESGHVTEIVTAALAIRLGRNVDHYRVTNVDGTVKLEGKGPYSPAKLIKIAKKAILEDIKLKKGKEKSPLRSSFETPTFYERNDYETHLPPIQKDQIL